MGNNDTICGRLHYQGGMRPSDFTFARMVNGKERVIDHVTVDDERYERVVRCRDCQHFTPKGTYKFVNGKVNNDCCDYVRGWRLRITPDGFCAWGERNEDGDGIPD